MNSNENDKNDKNDEAGKAGDFPFTGPEEPGEFPFMDQAWIDIEGFEGFYQINEKGEVRSLPRVIEMIYRGKVIKKIRQGKILQPQKGIVCLSVGGQKTMFNVSDLRYYYFGGGF